MKKERLSILLISLLVEAKCVNSYDVLSVRDQARHSSILMTDIYTPHDIQEANDLIKNYQGDF